ncbi:Tn3 family transposase [Streptomyces sp. NPDC048352]|uniref:Tn3 family transposase n=1 Tax=Streptomyces sp. NPDC048352 TaxID=3154718 RepID=UPI003416AB9F
MRRVGGVLHRQLTVQESRHKLARDVCHGKRGTIHQAYRDGMEDLTTPPSPPSPATTTSSAPPSWNPPSGQPYGGARATPCA